MAYLTDAWRDTLGLLPFLVFIYFIVSFLEYRYGDRMGLFLAKVGFLGPLAGALAGCIPQCGFSGNAVNILRASGVEKLHTVNVLEDAGIRQGIKEYANWPTIPQLYINGEFIGGSDIMTEMFQSGELKKLVQA